MPTRQTPGTYVERTGTRAIAPAPTGITAFVGHTLEGPINQVVAVKSFLEYSQNFGGLAASSELSYAVLQFFRNGGEKALIVRVPELETGSVVMADEPGYVAPVGTAPAYGYRGAIVESDPLADATSNPAEVGDTDTTIQQIRN